MYMLSLPAWDTLWIKRKLCIFTNFIAYTIAVIYSAPFPPPPSPYHTPSLTPASLSPSPPPLFLLPVLVYIEKKRHIYSFIILLMARFYFKALFSTATIRGWLDWRWCLQGSTNLDNQYCSVFIMRMHIPILLQLTLYHNNYGEILRAAFIGMSCLKCSVMSWGGDNWGVARNMVATNNLYCKRPLTNSLLIVEHYFCYSPLFCFQVQQENYVMFHIMLRVGGVSVAVSRTVFPPPPTH